MIEKQLCASSISELIIFVVFLLFLDIATPATLKSLKIATQLKFGIICSLLTQVSNKVVFHGRIS